MSDYETDTPSRFLSLIIEGNTNLTEDESNELAALIQDSGFVSIHHNIASQIADWIGFQADNVIKAGDVAECAAPVPGEHGRADCVEARDALREAPAHWIHTVAGDLEKGRYL